MGKSLQWSIEVPNRLRKGNFRLVEYGIPMISTGGLYMK